MYGKEGFYGKLDTQQVYYVSDKPYLDGQYYVDKCIIVSYIFCPFFKKLLRQEAHFGKLITTEERLEHLKNMWDDDYDDNHKEMYEEVFDEFEKYYREQDLTKEITLYCPSPEKGKIYFYKKAFHKNIELPIFFSLLGDFVCDLKEPFYKPDCSINKQNYKEYTHTVRTIILNYIQDGVIKRDSENTYINFTGRLGRFLKNLYFNDRYDLSLREIDNEISEYNEPFICIYFRTVIESILNEYFKNELLARCKYCNKIMRKITPSKIYCSDKIEGENCRKKAQNKRYNEKIKIKK